jgi:thiamine-phosphate pyrophosphorylase
MKSFADCRLYAFVDTAYLHGRDAGVLAKALCEGGADLIQLRAKSLTADAIRPMALAVARVAEDMGVRFVLNDHWELGVQLGLPAVHLGQDDVRDQGWMTDEGEVLPIPNPDRQQREGLPALGLSSHAPEQALRAVALGADYVAVGPVYPTATKPGRPPVTLDYVRWAAENIRIPWFAIGGINLENLDEVVEAGATRVCVVSAILDRSDVAEACREFRRRLPN